MRNTADNRLVTVTTVTSKVRGGRIAATGPWGEPPGVRHEILVTVLGDRDFR
jgi:hypothetical protein